MTDFLNEIIDDNKKSVIYSVSMSYPIGQKIYLDPEKVFVANKKNKILNLEEIKDFIGLKGKVESSDGIILVRWENNSKSWIKNYELLRKIR